MGIKTAKRNKKVVKRKLKLAPPRKRTKKLYHNKDVKLQPGGPVNKLSAAGVRFHKGYVFDQLRHTVLTHTQMNKVDKDFALARIKTVTHGPEAMTLPGEPGWRASFLDMHGRVILVDYRGVEIALFYKRQLTELKLDPGDPHPEGVLQDPEEAWQRLDLIGQSAKKANLVLASSMKNLEAQNKLLTSRIETQQTLIDKLEDDLKSKEKARAEAVKQLSKKRRK